MDGARASHLRGDMTRRRLAHRPPSIPRPGARVIPLRHLTALSYGTLRWAAGPQADNDNFRHRSLALPSECA